MTKTILKGHVSEETAYVVEDYPYGFRLRCKMRYWLEYKPKLGFRMMAQTTNPKRGDIWNKPKATTYYRFGVCLYLDENGHVQYTGLTEYCTAQTAADWKEEFGEGVPEIGQALLARWVSAKLAHEAPQ